MNNYHTHTFRCTHAKGNEETMVKAAIEYGYSELGFSEHIPLPYFRLHLIKALPFSIRGVWSSLSWLKAFLFNGPGIRMPYKEKREHLKAIKEAKNKYGNAIQIYTGFECEYLDDYLNYYKEILESKEVDYLILGHHFDKYAIGRRYYGRPNLTIKDVEKYVETAKKAMNTGMFIYFAHPDIFMNGYREWNDKIEHLVYELCECAKINHIPLELNAGGVRRSQIEINGKLCYCYPNYYFWEVASRVGCEAIIGMDAHDPSHLNTEDYQKLEDFAKELNLQVITTLK